MRNIVIWTQSLVLLSFFSPISLRGLWADYAFLALSIFLLMRYTFEILKSNLNNKFYYILLFLLIAIFETFILTYQLNTHRYEAKLVKTEIFATGRKESYFKYKSYGCGNGIYWENMVYDLFPIVEFLLKRDDCSHFFMEEPVEE